MAKIGIALSSGGFRGFIQAGIVKCLDSYGIKPVAISGSSIGSLIGGAYASGLSGEEIASKAEELKLAEAFSFLDLGFKGGIIKGGKLVEKIGDYLKKKRIGDFRTKYGAVATDIMKREPYVIDSGYAPYAIRASTCVPVVFEPFRYRGRLLVDGGVTDPLPADVAFSMGAEKVIGVDVSLWTKKYPKDAISMLRAIVPAFMLSITRWQEKYYGDRLLVLRPDWGKISTKQWMDFGFVVEYGEKFCESNINRIDRWLDE